MALLSEIDYARKSRSNQRLYLLEKSDDNKKFSVIGTTGNVYEVENEGENLWSCTCPDYKKRHVVCKHCYFVIDKNLCSVKEAPKEVVEQWKKRKSNKNGVEQKSLENEVCGICIDEMGQNEKLVYCKYSCGKSVHEECFKMWEKKGKTTCVYCRQNMYENECDGYTNVSKLLKTQ
jgi:hypothetical protein